MPVLVVIAGPQASGKSTVARALADELRRGGESVALVELDQIAAMALPTLPDWTIAHDIFASVTAQWLRSGVTCVVAEGVGSRDEVSKVLDEAAAATVVTVAVTVPFEIAYSRAQADATRGVSRDRDYLSAVYERWTGEIDRVAADVVLDTGALAVDRGVERVRAAIDSARRAPGARRPRRSAPH